MFVYVRSESRLYTVGFYDPQGKWHPDSDHNTSEEAARRVNWLHGGDGEHYPESKSAHHEKIRSSPSSSGDLR